MITIDLSTLVEIAIGASVGLILAAFIIDLLHLPHHRPHDRCPR